MSIPTQERGIYFGPARFKKIYGSIDTYCFYSDSLPDDLANLLTNAFIANSSPDWDPRLKGHECAVIARTFCDDATIDSPPPGLRCIRLDKSLLGPGEKGTPIAVVVDGITDAAECVVSGAAGMPSEWMPFMLSHDMLDGGARVVILGDCNSSKPRYKVTIRPGPYTRAVRVTVCRSDSAYYIQPVAQSVCGMRIKSKLASFCVYSPGDHCPFFRSIAPVFCDTEETINPANEARITKHFAYCDHYATEGDVVDASSILLGIRNAPDSIDESTINEITYSILNRLQAPIKEAIAQEIHSALSPSNQA